MATTKIMIDTDNDLNREGAQGGRGRGTQKDQRKARRPVQHLHNSEAKMFLKM